MDFFDESQLNDEFITKIEEYIKFDGIDSHLIATKIYNHLKNYKLVQQIDIKDCDIDFNQLIELKSIQPEIKKLVKCVQELDYAEFELIYYNIVNIVPFKRFDNSNGYSDFYKSIFNNEMMAELAYYVINSKEPPSSQDVENILMKHHQKYQSKLQSFMDNL